MHFDPDRFDINEDYEKDWIKKYNKEKVKLQHELLNDKSQQTF
jgi:hypothetical protein